MRLSIIIVNYNVEHFLEQCLLSVRKAVEGVDAEVIVVDNASVDGSVDMVKERFQEVVLIDNKDNRGFSKANNQGIKISRGEYVLLLNPDTVVEEETFKICLDFMDAHPDCGGLGVRMLDGKGIFLPESKRGLPTPDVAFYKIFGLSNLFPKSKRFGKYHLGYLDEHETHEVEILSGAYMFLRKESLDKIGLLDEEYFMYGEDIDLSYRLIKGGYKNYYTPDTRIIHYKGESTKKTSVNYVLVFYNAMRIFARKHFSAQHARSYNKLIELAIYARASISLIKRFLQGIMHPLIDLVLIAVSIRILSQVYGDSSSILFPDTFLNFVLPLYTLLWVISSYLSSGYEHPLKGRRKVQGVLIGTAFILILYSLLPETYRFSRAVILLGAGVSALLMLISNAIVRKLSKSARTSEDAPRRFTVIGRTEEEDRIRKMMVDMGISNEDIIGLDPSDEQSSADHIAEVTTVHAIDEIIFCAKDISSERIIDLMTRLDSSRLDFKIAPPESMFIIGSNSKENSGDLLTFEMNAIGKPVNRRNKRVLDFSSSLFLILASPVMLIFQKRPGRFIRNLFQVLVGKKSWVGYHLEAASQQQLPLIKPSILNPDQGRNLTQEQRKRSNILYAKDFSLEKDLDIIIQNWRNLGGS